ncbi:MAG: PQQ-binding-like beta-propeller repeat protein [Candidatus Sericytochromatia bacterium]|nr:PQQ-binding-like beta-propeller repeat protein [Candidatus Sericytochromatia bacterium]
MQAQTTRSGNPEFQEQLIQEYLLEQGKINPEQLSTAVSRLRQYKMGQGSQKRAVSYVMDQKTYALREVDPWSGKTLRQLSLPTTRKYQPRYMSLDWMPAGSGSVYLFHANNARELGEIVWSGEEAQSGLTVSDDFVHLYFGELDEHPYLALSHQLHYPYIPLNPTKCLPLDMVLNGNRQQLFLADRGRGTIFIVDLESFTVTSSLIVRPPGSRKTLNLAPTPDGQRLFITDNSTPALLVVNLKTLKIKRQPLPYGILGNLRISPDGQWLYIQSTRPDERVELIVLDTTNLLHRSTIALHGNLFSTLDDPLDLMAVSPQQNFLIFMTYVDNPAMFTPWINIIDLATYQLIDRYALLTDDSKPSHISFATSKPEGYFKSEHSILDVLLEMEYITIQDVEEAEWTLHETMSGRNEEPALNLAAFDLDDSPDSFFDLPPEEEAAIEAVEAGRGDPAVEYPVLHDHQIDPSILIQFRESLLRQYEFVPINQLNGIFRVACVNPARPEIEMITQKLFPDLPLYLIPFEKAEFERFMREFYATIMTRMKNIVSRMNPEQKQDFASTAPPGVVENLEAFAAPAYAAEKPAEKPPETPAAEPEAAAKPAPSLPPPVQFAQPPAAESPAEPKAEAAPEPSATKPDPEDASPAEAGPQIDASALPAELVNRELLNYCVNEFKKIWGIDVSDDQSVRDKLQPIVERARRELLNFDYTIIRVADLYNQFSLETVITQETFQALIQPLQPKPAAEAAKPAAAPATAVQTLADKVQEAEARPAAALQFESDDEVLRSDDLPSDTFLMSDLDRQRIIEFTNKGVIKWQIGGHDGIGGLTLVEPQNPIRLPNGNTLFADAGQDVVMEVSKSGQIRWQFPPADKSSDIRLHRPVKAMRKLNGNTIIVDQGNHRIIEINGQNKIVWQYGITASVGINRGRLYSPSDMQCLKGGHFLITDTDNHRVIEVNSDEEIIWQYGNPDNKLGSGYGSLSNQLNAPTQAFRLPNGHTLIADSENRRVIEVNPKGELAWTFDTGIEKASGGAFSFVPVRLIRMGNGNTVVFSPLYVIEVTRLLRPLYLYQYANLPKAENYQQQVADSEKIVPLSSKPSSEHINALARQAAQKYVVSQATLTEIEIPLIDKSENRVYLVNRQKQIVWRLGEDKPSHPLHLERPQFVELSEREDSEVLVTDTDNHRVFRVYRPTKEIIWQYGEKGVMGSRPGLLGHPRSAVTTAKGTVLIADQYSGRVIEVDKNGQLIWAFGGWDTGVNPLNAPYYAELTPDDTLLVTDWSNHYVLEANRQGEIIWRYGTLKNPGTGPQQLMYPERAHRLINGNTLIVDTRNHRVLEVDPAGGISWQYGGNVTDNAAKMITNPTAAQRLSNGHTLIVHSGNRQLLEVTMHHQAVWQYLLPAQRR